MFDLYHSYLPLLLTSSNVIGLLDGYVKMVILLFYFFSYAKLVKYCDYSNDQKLQGWNRFHFMACCYQD